MKTAYDVYKEKAREFTQMDWNGFSGAVKFENGDNPIILDAEELGSFLIIVDPMGIGIYIYNSECDRAWQANADGNWDSPEDTEFLVEHVLEEFSVPMTEEALDQSSYLVEF